MEAIKNYLEQKVAGLVTVIKTDPNDASEGATYAVCHKKWDAATGAKLADEVVGVNKTQLLAKRTELANQIDMIDTFLADAEKPVVIIKEVL